MPATRQAACPPRRTSTNLRRALTACGVWLALALGACGGSEEDDVRSIARQVATNDEKVCDKVTNKFLAAAGSKENCRKSAKQADNSNPPKVGDVKVDGEKATAVLSGGGTEATLQLVKDGGDWKLNGVE